MATCTSIVTSRMKTHILMLEFFLLLWREKPQGGVLLIFPVSQSQSCRLNIRIEEMSLCLCSPSHCPVLSLSLKLMNFYKQISEFSVVVETGEWELVQVSQHCFLAWVLKIGWLNFGVWFQFSVGGISRTWSLCFLHNGVVTSIMLWAVGLT